MPRRTFLLSLAVLALAFAGLVCAPAAASAGCAAGLRLCAKSILPALFPFLVLSELLAALGAPEALGRRCAKLLGRLFALPGSVAAALLLGLGGGYPLGAMALSRQVREGRLSREDAARALPVCNNSGPAFCIGAVGVGVFGSGAAGAVLYLSHVLAALALGLAFSRGRAKE